MIDVLELILTAYLLCHASASIMISVVQRYLMNNKTKLTLEMKKHLSLFSPVLFKNTLDKSFLSLDNELKIRSVKV